MNENAKKVGLIAVIVVAVAIAAYGAKSVFSGDKVQVEKVIAGPPGMKSEKQRFLEEQAANKQAATPPTAAPPSDPGARDLGGDLGGGG